MSEGGGVREHGGVYESVGLCEGSGCCGQDILILYTICNFNFILYKLADDCGHSACILLVSVCIYVHTYVRTSTNAVHVEQC